MRGLWPPQVSTARYWAGETGVMNQEQVRGTSRGFEQKKGSFDEHRGGLKMSQHPPVKANIGAYRTSSQGCGPDTDAKRRTVVDERRDNLWIWPLGLCVELFCELVPSAIVRGRNFSDVVFTNCAVKADQELQERALEGPRIGSVIGTGTDALDLVWNRGELLLLLNLRLRLHLVLQRGERGLVEPGLHCRAKYRSSRRVRSSARR